MNRYHRLGWLGMLAGLACGLQQSRAQVFTPSPANWIDHVYYEAVNRPADAGGLAFWNNFLTQQGNSPAVRSQIALQILSSQEGRNVLAADLFQLTVQRQPTSQESLLWAQQLQAGMTEFGLRATIEGSPEYFQTRAANDNAAWVADVFQDTLGRAPLANESLFWIGTLNQQVSRSQVAQSIGASAEGLQSWVGGVFEDYLNRAPDPGGLATYTSFLQQGGTPLNARATILGSGEFYGLQARTELQEAVVPEPQAYAMVAGLGLTGLVVWRRRQAARA